MPTQRRRRVRARTILIQVLCIGIALVAGLFLLSSRLGGRSLPVPSALAAEGARGRVPARLLLDAGDTLIAPVTTDAGAAAAGGGGQKPDDEEEATPVDSAITPDGGGVPTHPGYRFKSPFGNPDSRGPNRIKVGFLLNTIDEYDVKTGTFEADFFVSLTSERAMPKLDLVSPNGSITDKNVLANKPTFKLYRVSGKFKSSPDLRRYPFDRQILRIELEDDTYGFDTVRFVPDPERTDLNIGFEVLGWDTAYVEARILSHAYPDRFEGDDLYYGRYVFRIALDRYGTSAIFKVYVPALVIVLIGLLGMWVPPGEMEVRSNAGAPMLAAAVLFHFALMQELPATSYLTRADKLMMGVYVSLLINMLSTWWMFLVEDETRDLVFRIARWVVPVGSVIMMGLASIV